MLEESLSGFSEISKGNLSEMKALVKPPEIIRTTIEAVFYMLEGFGRRANNASKACGSLFKWVTASYKHAKVLLEIKPLEEEIEKFEREINSGLESISREEENLTNLEKKASAMKNEYASSSAQLEATKADIVSMDNRMKLIEKTMTALSDEVWRWKQAEYMYPIRHILTGKDWMLRYNKNLLIYDKGTEAEICKLPSFVSTSLKDKNYRQVLLDCKYYKSGVVIRDCSEFNGNVYRLLKHQMLSSAYPVITLHETDSPLYREYAYVYRAERTFEVRG